MSRLFYANLVRMIRCKIFWVLEIFLAGYDIFAYASLADNIRKGGMIPTSLLPYFFNEMLAMGAVTALFTVFFLGVEYGDGIIRNKISVGHTRKDIYLANLFTCYIASVIQFLTYTLTALLTGWGLIGKDSFNGFNQIPWRIGCSLLILLVYVSLFTMLVMLDSSKARVTAVSFVLVISFFVLIMQIYGDLAQPELTSRAVFSSETGELQMEENIPNPRYVSGTKRVVYEWIDAFLPADQAMHVLYPETEFAARAPLCMLGESIILTGFGLYAFKKKDIK